MSANAGGLIVCLVGFPGVGKLTIAKILSRMIGAKIVDNHWINDPILGLIADDGSNPLRRPSGHKSRRSGRRCSTPSPRLPQLEPASSLRTLVRMKTSTITARFRNTEALPCGAGAIRRRPPLVRRGQLSRRIQSAEQVGRKLVDPADAIVNVRSYTPLNPHVPNTLTLDTTNLSPEAAATAILAHIDAGRSG